MKSLIEIIGCIDDYDPDALAVDQARAVVRAFITPVTTNERIALRAGLGRVLGEDIVSTLDVPAHDNSAMDGYALRHADLNAEGETVLRLARRYRKMVLIASSSEVYGKSEAIPFREDGDRVMGPTIKSRWSYAESKAMDEFLALAYHQQFGVPVIIGRFFNTVGPRQTGTYGMVVPRLAKQAAAGQPLTVYGDGRQTRCFCNVKDTVRAVVSLSQEAKAIGEIFNIGSSEEITILDLAKRIRNRSGNQSEIKLIAYDQAYGAGFEDTRRRVPDTTKIKAAIGWQPTIGLEQTLDEVIAQFK